MTERCCLICQRQGTRVFIDFGEQPVSNRLVEDPAAPEYVHPMALAQCPACGLVQLAQPMLAEEVRPRQPMTYNEPEGHLDRLADRLAAWPGLAKDAVIAGTTAKDDTLLRRLRERGFTNTWRLDPARDLGITDPCAGLETIQARLDAEAGARMAASHGAADLLIARHILEHALDLRAFLDGLRAMVRPNGIVVLEVPDCERSLARAECSMAWEEHIVYFTEATFRRQFMWTGWSLEACHRFRYALEDSLVAIIKPAANDAVTESIDAAELRLSEAFAEGLARKRETIRAWLKEWTSRGPVALLGAGHHGCAFINLLGLRDLIAFVADDHPAKQGKFMPGSPLPILPSQALQERAVGLCLLSLSPESEQRVIARHQAFMNNGGRFVSIFTEDSALPQVPEPADVR